MVKCFPPTIANKVRMSILTILIKQSPESSSQFNKARIGKCLRIGKEERKLFSDDIITS